MFKFKGISSKDMQVVVKEEEHFIAKAEQRYEAISIDGKDGALFDVLGYSYVERPICVQCLNINKIDNILAWLNGEGEFEYKDRKTIARFYNQLEPQRNACIRTIDTTFIRDPFWHKINDEFVQVANDIQNKGNVNSRPILRLEKGAINNVDITINGIRFLYDFNDETYVEIDCENKTVLHKNLNRFRRIKIGYEFPKLNVGANTVKINSGDCLMKVKRKDRWL